MRTPPNPNANKRRTAYVDRMHQLGLTPEVIAVEGEGWNIEEIGFLGGRKILSEGRLPTNTVFCSNDRLAIGFLAAAYEMGIRVGRSEGCALRVAGHDNHPFSRFTCPTLTTVSHNYSAIAQKSVEALLGLIDSGATEAERETMLFDGELIMRASA